MIRAALRRWLGVPTREEIRAMVLREIDADRVTGSCHFQESLVPSRIELEAARDRFIRNGKREDTRVSL